MSLDPILPDYDGACLSRVVPTLLARARGVPPWLPPVAAAAEQVVLLVLDGVGWEQLQERIHLAPTLAAMTGGPITSVAPTTTSTALTSITTGLPPAAHGVLGYRVRVGEAEVMNVLRWRTAAGDAQETVPPAAFQTAVPFGGTAPPVVTRAEFEGGGFSDAHLTGARHHGWRMPSTLVANIETLLRTGEEFVYGYYDGVDKVAHEFGLGRHYELELRAADRLVADVLGILPAGAALVVTSDHGQVDVAGNLVPLHTEVMGHVQLLSGEGRFRWLHARPGTKDALIDTARRHHGGQAWVRSRDEAVAEGWFGGPLRDEFARRVGDVVIAAREPVAFLDPADSGPYRLVSRHGSLTAAEMYVPLLAATA